MDYILRLGMKSRKNMANCPQVKEWPKCLVSILPALWWWISESPSSRAQIGRTTVLLIDLRVSPDPVCIYRMATLLLPSVPGISFSILAMGQRECLLSSDISTRLPTCTSDFKVFHLALDW
ncbi:hypothetical protein TNCV_3181991 [Trichonephila clavipes]|nr:hypothetical protein TNCV_3181991 [Trichonephila clavipes]